jgi:hypothetical protein
VTQPLDTEVAAKKYRSFEECESKRTESEEAWRVGFERNVVGSVCAFEDEVIGPYRVVMRLFWID